MGTNKLIDVTVKNEGVKYNLYMKFNNINLLKKEELIKNQLGIVKYNKELKTLTIILSTLTYDQDYRIDFSIIDNILKCSLVKNEKTDNCYTNNNSIILELNQNIMENVFNEKYSINIGGENSNTNANGTLEFFFDLSCDVNNNSIISENQEIQSNISPVGKVEKDLFRGYIIEGFARGKI